jgi:hypothetical protein
MTSRRETVLSALFALLDGALSSKVLRNEPLPERIPQEGLLILRDGEPGEPSVTLSPVSYLYEHRAELDVAVQTANASARDADFDGLLKAIAAAIAGDRTLGGLADRVAALAPVPSEIAADGAVPIKAATVPVVLIYATTDPLT